MTVISIYDSPIFQEVNIDLILNELFNLKTPMKIKDKYNLNYHSEAWLKNIKKYKPKINYAKSEISKKDMKYIFEYKGIIYNSNNEDLVNKFNIIEKFKNDIIEHNNFLIGYYLKHNYKPNM
jgi:hypothetical protein